MAILTAKQHKSKELTAEDLDRLALKVCAECGIKDAGLPSEEIIDLCLKSWIETFAPQMNGHELALAFEMNINGLLQPKVEHYQCFSRDFFCTVCQRYLDKRQESMMRNKHVEPEVDIAALKEANHDTLLMHAIIQDRRNATAGKPITETYPVKDRANLLAEMFEVPISEKEITGYRVNAKNTVLADLAKKKTDARALGQFGKEVELTNQISRIKEGKLITQDDEDRIQLEVLKLLYCNSLLKWGESEFIDHIEGNIKQLEAQP